MCHDIDFEEVTFQDVPAMFTPQRIKRADVPAGMYRYELREGDGDICELSTSIFVNHYGTLLTSQAIQLPMLTGLDCCVEDIDFLCWGCSSLKEFMDKHPHVPDDTIKWFNPTPEESALFYSQGHEADVANRCIGHLRGDFFRSEKLRTTWHPHYWDQSLNDVAFKADLKRVMEWLQADYTPLHSMEDLKLFCDRVDEFSLPNQDRGACGVRVETTHYRYMLRCLPQEGDYNVYLYCYSMEEAA